DRLQDRQDGLAPQIQDGGRLSRRAGIADDGRKAALRRRRLGQLRRVRSGRRQAAVAHADRSGVERAGNVHGRRAAARPGGGRRHAVFVCAVSITLSAEFRSVLIWTSHGDTETQRRSTRAACTAGRAVRRADRKRTTEPQSSGRSFAVGTPRPPLGGAASSALPKRVLLCVFVFSVAKYVVVFLKWGTERRHETRRRKCEIEYLAGR